MEYWPSPNTRIDVLHNKILSIVREDSGGGSKRPVLMYFLEMAVEVYLFGRNLIRKSSCADYGVLKNVQSSVWAVLPFFIGGI